jgi:indole-3-glycerol phosphate synthase
MRGTTATSKSYCRSCCSSRYVLHLCALLLPLLSPFTALWGCHAFVPAAGSRSITSAITYPNPGLQQICRETTTTRTKTQLHAIAVLVKKAKQAQLRAFVAAGVPEHVSTVYAAMKEAAAAASPTTRAAPGPLQQALTRRRGTITVIAEYNQQQRRQTVAETKKKGNDLGAAAFLARNDPELLSPMFRESGSAAIAFTPDFKAGEDAMKNADDLRTFVEEQRRALQKVPGPVPVVWNDVIVDELQIAMARVENVAAVVLSEAYLSNEELAYLLQCCAAVDLEAMVAVSTPDGSQAAVQAGARMLLVQGQDGADEKSAIIEELQTAAEAGRGEGGQQAQITFIANIAGRAKSEGVPSEIEEAWAVRDKGFHSVWVSDAVLFKEGENPAAILKTMRSKSSLRWASPKAQTSRGEGAREYLGDILM